QNHQTYFVPNGTDLSHSNRPDSLTYAVHAKLVNIQRPIVGYLGTIERRIDYPLIEEVVKTNPDVSFVFAGPISKGFVPELLFRMSNVHFLGPIAHQDVEQVIS